MLIADRTFDLENWATPIVHDELLAGTFRWRQTPRFAAFLPLYTVFERDHFQRAGSSDKKAFEAVERVMEHGIADPAYRLQSMTILRELEPG
jgi:hypothetical protein